MVGLEWVGTIRHRKQAKPRRGVRARMIIAVEERERDLMTAVADSPPLFCHSSIDRGREREAGAAAAVPCFGF